MNVQKPSDDTLSSWAVVPPSPSVPVAMPLPGQSNVKRPSFLEPPQSQGLSVEGADFLLDERG